MVDRNLLLDITSIPSPSGYEDTLIEYIEQYANKNFKNVKAYVDSGELYLVRLSSNLEEAKTILFDAHIDQVSCRVLKITPDGFLLARCFGINNSEIMGKNVQIITEKGILDGIITIVPPHLNIKNKNIYIDIMAKSQAEANTMVDIGDPIYFTNAPKIIRGHIVGAGLDNHIGVYCLLELARKINQSPHIDNNLIIHFSRREEVSGLKYLGILDDFHNMPKRIDLVFVVDTDIANDVPSITSEKQPDSYLGRGPIITRNLMDDNVVYRYLKHIAGKTPFQVVMSDGDGGNNLTQYAQLSTLGQSIGIPLRNMHSTVETVLLDDIWTTIELLYKAFVYSAQLFHRK